MRAAALALFATLAVSGSALAHGNAVHHRGVVTQINGQSVTIQTATKPPKTVTFTVADYTEIDRGTKVAALKDLKVGDRVVVEIPKGKTEAESIKIGATTPANATTTAKRKA
jgi:hypothetical protein